MDSQVAGPSHIMNQDSPGLKTLRNSRLANPNTSSNTGIAGVQGNGETDMSLLCRICASTHEHLIPIFAEEGLENKLVDKIHNHLPIKVDIKDSLPDHVCYQCASTLLAWHDLVQCCIQSNITLLERVNRMNTSKASDAVQSQEISVENGSQNTRGRSQRGSHNVKKPQLRAGKVKELRICLERMISKDTPPISKVIRTSAFKISKESRGLNSTGRHYKTCTICDQKYSSAAFQRHLVKCKKQVTCTKCSQRFNNKTEYREHCLKCLSILNCNKCLEKFDNMSILEEHNESCSVFACKLCPKQFVSILTLATHMTIKHVEKKIFCIYCKMRFKETDFSKHKVVNHKFICETCLSIFTSNIECVEKKGYSILCNKCVTLDKQTEDNTIAVKGKTTKPDVRLPYESDLVESGPKEKEKSSTQPKSKKKHPIIVTDKCPHCLEAVAKIFNFKNHVKICSELAAYMKKKEAVMRAYENKRKENIYELSKSASMLSCGIKDTEKLIINNNTTRESLTLNSSCNSGEQAEKEISSEQMGYLENISSSGDSKNTHITHNEPMQEVVILSQDDPKHREIKINKALLKVKYVNNTQSSTVSSEVQKKLTEQALLEVELISKEKWSNALERYESDIDELFDKISLSRSASNVFDQVLLCQICHKTFSHGVFRQHLISSHKMNIFYNISRQYQCVYCDVQSDTLNEMNQHFYNKHITVYKCDHCRRVFTSKGSKLSHILSNHPDQVNYECHLCPYKINNRIQLRQHILWHSLNEIRACNICNKKFKGRKKYNQHARYHKSNASCNSTYLCPKCGKHLTSSSGLRQHLLYAHHPMEFILCADCGKLVAKRNISRHRKLHQLQKTHERSYQCNQCPSSFKRKQSLTVHKNNHYSKTVTVCRFCGVDFGTHDACQKHTVEIHQKKIMETSDKMVSSSTVS